MKTNPLLLAAALLGATAVAAGAFAAHGLDDALAGLGYGPDQRPARIENFLTGVRYQLPTAVAVLVLALSLGEGVGRRLPGWLLVGGVAVFSGCLYGLAFGGDGWRWLGAVVPLGGLALIGGWTLLGAAAFTKRAETDASVEGSAKGPTNEQELIRLEELLSHQQKLLSDLDDALRDARRDADGAALRVKRLEETTRRLHENLRAVEEGPADERPPHY